MRTRLARAATAALGLAVGCTHASNHPASVHATQPRTLAVFSRHARSVDDAAGARLVQASHGNTRDLAVLQQLHCKGADPIKTWGAALDAGDICVVRFLVDSVPVTPQCPLRLMAGVSAKINKFSPPDSDYSLEHLATLVQKLIQPSTDLDTLLKVASQHFLYARWNTKALDNITEVVQMLLDLGANPNAGDETSVVCKAAASDAYYAADLVEMCLNPGRVPKLI
jgi:hypothetical protein